MVNSVLSVSSCSKFFPIRVHRCPSVVNLALFSVPVFFICWLPYLKINVGEGGPRRAKAVFCRFKWAKAGESDAFSHSRPGSRPPWPGCARLRKVGRAHRARRLAAAFAPKTPILQHSISSPGFHGFIIRLFMSLLARAPCPDDRPLDSTTLSSPVKLPLYRGIIIGTRAV